MTSRRDILNLRSFKFIGMAHISADTKLETLGVLNLPAIQLIQEGSWGQRDIGTHASSMTFYRQGTYHLIEWDIPTLDECEHIGLTFDSQKRLIDYDGICGDLPIEAVRLIRQCGFIVPREFTS